MKGKKFNAAEKHFQEKEIKMRQETTFYKNRMKDLEISNTLLIEKNKQLTKENVDIKSKYDKLLEYAKLSEIDIMTALRKDKTIEQLGTLMNITKHMSRY
jgi:predicted nuclease with TOPRIM domain